MARVVTIDLQPLLCVLTPYHLKCTVPSAGFPGLACLRGTSARFLGRSSQRPSAGFPGRVCSSAPIMAFAPASKTYPCKKCGEKFTWFKLIESRRGIPRGPQGEGEGYTRFWRVRKECEPKRMAYGIELLDSDTKG